MNLKVIENIYQLRIVSLEYPDKNLLKELEFTDSLKEENWPNRKDFIAFVNEDGIWNDFSPAQHSYLKSIGANYDAACYTYTIRKDKLSDKELHDELHLHSGEFIRTKDGKLRVKCSICGKEDNWD